MESIEDLPGLYSIDKIGEENLDNFVYNIAFPLLKKQFGVKPKELKGKEFTGYKLLDEDSIHYNRKTRGINLHSNSLHANDLGEELQHYFVNAGRGDEPGDIDEFFGMLGRLSLWDKLKDTKYAKLFGNGFDKSLDGEGYKYFVDSASELIKQQNKIYEQVACKLNVSCEVCEEYKFAKGFYEALYEKIEKANPEEINTVTDIKDEFNKYVKQTKSHLEYYRELEVLGEDVTKAKKNMREELIEFKDKFKTNEDTTPLYIITEAHSNYLIKMCLVSEGNSRIRSIDNEKSILLLNHLLEQTKNINEIIENIENGLTANKLKKDEFLKITKEVNEYIGNEIKSTENELLEEGKFAKELNEKLKQGMGDISPPPFIEQEVESVTCHKTGYDAGLKAEEKIRIGEISYENIWKMSSDEIKEQFF